MNIFILANKQQEKEILSIPPAESTSLTFASRVDELNDASKYDAFFLLTGESLNFKVFANKPVFINEVIKTLSEINLPSNVARINGWFGFLERSFWEVVSNHPDNKEAIFAALNRKAITLKDEPGFVAARVMSMIVNEAFYALGENISSIEDIDSAMVLGTNYPGGPFEWVEKIGVENFYRLLKKLAEKEERYLPAPALEKLYLEIQERVDQ
ncbi:MAG: 3-hydroxyacyl-CoA dehydrogenase family protein [Ginsengibacter sp.]